MRRFFIVVVVAVSMLAACSSSSKSSSGSATTTTSSAAPSGTTPTTAGAGNPRAAGTVVLNVVHNAKVNQTIIVDAATRTVYMYVPDGSSQTSTVPAALKTAWPAVKTTAASPT